MPNNTDRKDAYIHSQTWIPFQLLNTARQIKEWTELKNRLSQNTLRELEPHLPKTKYLFWATCVILSAAAVEAFINAMIKDVAIKENTDPKLRTFLENSLNSKQLSTRKKLTFYTKVLTGISLEDNKSLWNGFKKLERLRDKILHYRLRPFKSEEAKTIAEVMSTRNTMSRKEHEKLLKSRIWENRLKGEITPETVQEAIDTARNIMHWLLNHYFPGK